MSKLDLSNVTLVCVDCHNVDRLTKTFGICRYYAEFFNCLLFTDIDKEISGVDTIKIRHIGDHMEYSRFMMKELYHHIVTDYILIVQHDGYILNPGAWEDEFLDYDYIGAPWKWAPEGTSIVGNGGFSLRSKFLLEMLQDDCIEVGTPEDNYICQQNYNYLVSKGVKFAPQELAARFSFENGRWGGQFGFHNDRITALADWKDKHIYDSLL